MPRVWSSTNPRPGASAIEFGTGLYGPKRKRITPKTAKALRWVGSCGSDLRQEREASRHKAGPVARAGHRRQRRYPDRGVRQRRRGGIQSWLAASPQLKEAINAVLEGIDADGRSYDRSANRPVPPSLSGLHPHAHSCTTQQGLRNRRLPRTSAAFLQQILLGLLRARAGHRGARGAHRGCPEGTTGTRPRRPHATGRNAIELRSRPGETLKMRRRKGTSRASTSSHEPKKSKPNKGV